MADYYVFYSDADGGHVQKFTKKELEADLQDEDGLIPGIMRCAEMDDLTFRYIEDVIGPDNWCSMNGWGYDIFIIKGTPVIPKAKSVVTVWEV